MALTSGPIDDRRQARLTALHQQLDAGVAAQELDLGCSYVEATGAVDLQALHPTWTHREFVRRTLSGISRAELVRHGSAVFGPSPAAVLPTMSEPTYAGLHRPS